VESTGGGCEQRSCCTQREMGLNESGKFLVTLLETSCISDNKGDNTDNGLNQHQ
jgi:hypothetical protein